MPGADTEHGMGSILSQAYLDDLWERIEDLEARLIAEPDNRGVALLLDCCLRNYESKLRLFNKDSNSLVYLN